MLQIVANSKSGNELTIVWSSDTTEEIVVPLNALYTRQSFEDFGASFSGINAYWKTLPASQQEEIFNCYDKIIDLCEITSLVDGVSVSNQGGQSTSSRKRIMLRSEIKKLLELNPYSEVKRKLKLLLPTQTIPDDIEVEVPARYLNQPRAKTYVREEYLELLIYLYYYKLIVPILGAMASNLKLTTMPKDDKEFFIYKELVGFEIFNTPEALRLMEYVESHFLAREHKFNRALTIHGISEEDIPDVVKGRVFVKALAVAEPQGTNAHVVTTVSKELQRRLQEIQSGFNNLTINNKTPRSEKTGEDTSLTNFDVYRSKTNVSNLTKGTLNAYSKNISEVLKRWIPEKDLTAAIQLTQQSIEYFRVKPLTHMVNPVWSHIAVGILDKCGIPTVINDHCDFDADIAQYSCVITILDYFGYSEIAAMMCTAMKTRAPGIVKGNLMFVGQAGQVLEKDIVNEITSYFPYYDPEPGSKARSGLNVYGLQVIDDCVRDFLNLDHEVSGPNWLVEKCGLVKGEEYELPADTKQQFAEVILMCLKHVPLIDPMELLFKEFPEQRNKLK